jgi:HD-GYP domain-containing protein (c-di-GMP phosphodiesterase class II)
MSTDDQSEKIQHLQGENARLQAEVHALTAALSKGQESLAASEIRLKLAFLATIQVLVQAVEIKDPYTVGHSNMTAKVAVAIARRLKSGDEDCERPAHLAALHAGHRNINSRFTEAPDQTGSLDRRGNVACWKSTSNSEPRSSSTVTLPWEVAALVYQHHERIDGSGYPEGLTGDPNGFRGQDPLA